MEMPSLVAGSQLRPADIFIPIWRDGRKTAFDVTVVSSLQPAYLELEAQTPGAALAARKAAKIRQHDQPCRDADISFVPLVVEALGGWDKDALVHLRELASASAKRCGDRPFTTTCHFFQRLSVSFQRGNATLLLKDRAPPLS
jgi:hypothetical protein